MVLSRVNGRLCAVWLVFVPLPPAPRRRDLCCAEAELNEIEEEFFLFCSFSFCVFTQILLKLNTKYRNKTAAVRGRSVPDCLYAVIPSWIGFLEIYI